MTDEAPKKKRSWIPIVIGVVILFAFIAIGSIGVSINYIRQHMVVTDSSEGDANRQLCRSEHLLWLNDRYTF